MLEPVTNREINALAAAALGRGDRLTVALVMRARQEEQPGHTAVLEHHGWGEANWRTCMAEVEELCRRARC
jgi:hypothetical protein